MDAVRDFVEAAAEQVRTVVMNTKTAAAVIFLCGLLTGCVVF